MKRLETIRHIIQALASVIFVEQMWKAVMKLENVPMMVSTETVDIQKISPPLLTICPLEQFNTSQLLKHGYNHEISTLHGQLIDGNTSYLSWGSHMNMKYLELLNNVTDQQDLQIIQEQNSELNLEKTIMPRLGYCLQSTNYSLDRVFVKFEKKTKNELMFALTDKSLKTYYDIYYQSQVGDEIVINPRKSLLQTYKADVSIYDFKSSSKGDDCIDAADYNYSECVDVKTLNDLNATFGCVPEWLSPQNPCSMVEKTNFVYFWDNYVYPYSFLLSTKAERQCKLPCNYQKIHVDSLGSSPHSHNGTYITIEIGKKVTVYKKLPNYNWFNFLIDCGSSMGMWLNLSVITLFDVCVKIFYFVNSKLRLIN